MDDAAAAQRRFDELVHEALTAPFVGWGFDYLAGRWQESPPPWDYRAEVVARLQGGVKRLLDMGTGGGEWLSTLQPLAPQTVATEGYAPNVAVAAGRLGPLGVRVVAVDGDDPARLPFADGAFDLVINRHDSYDPAEVRRVLKPGGWFITQQVGELDGVELNRWLQLPVHGAVSFSYPGWDLAAAARALEAAGFVVVKRQEAFPPAVFHDIGAVVYYLRAIPWQIPDFSVERYYQPLLALHRHIERNGPLTVHGHRFLLVARRD